MITSKFQISVIKCCFHIICYIIYIYIYICKKKSKYEKKSKYICAKEGIQNFVLTQLHLRPNLWSSSAYLKNLFSHNAFPQLLVHGNNLPTAHPVRPGIVFCCGHENVPHLNQCCPLYGAVDDCYSMVRDGWGQWKSI